LGGPITEIVHAVGRGANVVGTDRSSLYPESILSGPRLDYFRQTSAEGVLALRPTLVLAVEGTGPPGVLDQIRTAGVTVIVLPEATDVASAETRVQRVGEVLGRPAQADSVVAIMRRDLAAAEALRPAAPPRVLFVYARGAGVVLAAGTGGGPEGVLRLAGAENAVTAYEGYRPLTAEAVAAAAPDVIVVPAKSLESLGGIDGLLRQPGLAQTPAGQARRIVAVDDDLLLGFGPRVGQGVEALVRGLTGGGTAG
jgi:iron complex transport system substrate-binding protein